MENKLCYPRILIRWKNGEPSCYNYSLNQFYLAFYDFEDFLKQYSHHFDSISFFLVQDPDTDIEHCQLIMSFHS